MEQGSRRETFGWIESASLFRKKVSLSYHSSFLTQREYLFWDTQEKTLKYISCSKKKWSSPH